MIERTNQPQGVSVRMEDLTDHFMRVRWEEVLQHGIVVERAEKDHVDDGYIVLYLDNDDADLWGLYPVLSVAPGGTIAEYNVNQPYHYMTFTQLLQAANVRTAAN